MVSSDIVIARLLGLRERLVAQGREGDVAVLDEAVAELRRQLDAEPSRSPPDSTK